MNEILEREVKEDKFLSIIFLCFFSFYIYKVWGHLNLVPYLILIMISSLIISKPARFNETNQSNPRR